MKQPTHRNNRIVFDMNKVSYAWFFYRNQLGVTLRNRPIKPTVNAVEFANVIAPWTDAYPGETMLERAKRLQILDCWKPVVRLRMSAADVLEYTGDKAKSIWREWNKRQFKSHGNTKTNTTKSRRN